MTDWKPHAGPQTNMLLSQAFEILFGGARGGGKDLHKDTKVLTTQGWKKACEITYQDQLITQSGKPTNILGIYPKSDRRMYKVIFDDQASVVCDAEHNWLVWSRDHGYRDGWKIRTTEEISKFKGRFAIPLMDRYYNGNYKPAYDPYILGLLLGDGTMTGAHPVIYTPDQEIRDYLIYNNWNVFVRRDKKQTLYQCSLSNSIKKLVYKELPLVSGRDKHIPEKLLDMSAQDRLELLQGLLDSDGSCEKTGSVRFSTVSQSLAEGVQYLVRSLGGKSSIQKQKPRKSGFSPEKIEEIRVSIGHIGKFQPFKLNKKAVRVSQSIREDKRYITSIEYVGLDDGVCFSVDDASHLYVIQDFIVTHNTEGGIVWLIEPNYIINPRYQALVLRKDAVDLSDWMDRAKYMYQRYGGKAIGNPATFQFPSGAVLRLGHLKDKKSYEKYLGHEYQKILIEELTQIPEEDYYVQILGSCRSTIDGLTPRILSTTNPGGVGHVWVKKRFVDPKPPNTEWIAEDTGRSRIFIPSMLEDNPTLMEKDPGYIKYLEGLQHKNKKLYLAWRQGRWDVFEGQYFNEWDREVHVIKPFVIPDNWLRYRSIDWGYRPDPAVCSWYAVDEDGRVYKYREIVVNEMRPSEFGLMVKEKTNNERVERTVGDPSMFKHDTGESISEQIWNLGDGIEIEPADNQRIAGWTKLREYFSFDNEKKPAFQVFDTCIHTIEHYSELIHDTRNPEDVKAGMFDHCADCDRYFVMSRPEAPIIKNTKQLADVAGYKAHSDFESIAKKNIEREVVEPVEELLANLF